MAKRKTTLPRAPRGSSAPGTPAAYASFWRVHLRTAQKWLAEPGRAAAPPTPPRHALDDPAAMVAWVRSLPTASQSKLTPTFRARIDLFRIALERGEPVPLPSSAPGAAPSASAPPPPGGNPRGASGATHSFSSPPTTTDDPDYTTFLSERAARAAAPRDANTTLASLKLRFEFADYKVGLAQRRGDHAACREWTDTAARLAGVIHDEELRAQKLGRETGDILPWPEVERILRALPYWLLRATDDLLTTLCPRLAAATATPLYPEEVRRLLEPTLLEARLLTPLTRAAQVNAGTALPERAVAALREALAATLEDGAALFDTLYQTPVPIPRPLVTTGHSSDGPAASATPSEGATPNAAAGSSEEIGPNDLIDFEQGWDRASAISSATPDLGSGASQTASEEKTEII